MADPSTEATANLTRVAAISDGNARSTAYTTFLSRAVGPPLVPQALLAFADHFISEQTPPSIAHALFASFAHVLPTLPSDLHKSLAVHVLTALRQRVHSFESEIITVRLALSKLYESNQEWTLAARALAEIPFDGVARVLTDAFRVEYYSKIARFYIEDDSPVEADSYNVRATMLMHACTDEGVKLMHKVSVARLLDSKRKFDDAAIKYYQLSQVPAGTYGDAIIGEGDAAEALNFAITCAILAPAGPRRSRVLAILYNDERSRSLSVHPLLESIHTGRLLAAEQVEAFRPTLRPHQLATNADGTTVLDAAVTEHNLLAVSRLYANIRFDELALVLRVPKQKAEDVCQLMAYEGRMQAKLDQVEGVVEFTSPAGKQQLHRWDVQIDDICSAVDGCSDAILKSYPLMAPRTGS